jgi:hypothetical protein
MKLSLFFALAGLLLLFGCTQTPPQLQTSSPGDATQFGNSSTTTCRIGGTAGNLSCTGNVSGSALYGNLNASYILLPPWLGSSENATINSLVLNVTNASQLSIGTLPDSRLNTTAVAAATYGNSTAVAQFTVDSKGRITSATNVSIVSGGTGTVTSVATGTGLQGGPITSSGTLAINSTYLNATYRMNSTEIPWTDLFTYPAACSAGSLMAGVGDTLTCNSIVNLTLAQVAANTGNWTLDKPSYPLTTYVNSLGNFSSDSARINTTFTNLYDSNVTLNASLTNTISVLNVAVQNLTSINATAAKLAGGNVFTGSNNMTQLNISTAGYVGGNATCIRLQFNSTVWFGVGSGC